LAAASECARHPIHNSENLSTKVQKTGALITRKIRLKQVTGVDFGFGYRVLNPPTKSIQRVFFVGNLMT
jgi:hypothetical protein